MNVSYEKGGGHGVHIQTSDVYETRSYARWLLVKSYNTHLCVARQTEQ